jgi:hypothetical protein
MDFFDLIFRHKQEKTTREGKEKRSSGGVVLPWEAQEILKVLGRGRDRKYIKQRTPTLGTAEARKARRERNKRKRISRVLHRKRLVHARQTPRARSRRKVNV